MLEVFWEDPCWNAESVDTCETRGTRMQSKFNVEVLFCPGDGWGTKGILPLYPKCFGKVCVKIQMHTPKI
eukprot:1022970-Pelagomonas_calceolata.AAC.4